MSNKPLSLGEGTLDFTISRMLSEKNVTTLKKIAKYCKLKGYSKMKKEELEGSLEGALCEEDRLRETLYFLDNKKWKLFVSLVSEEYIELDDNTEKLYANMEYRGIIHKFSNNKISYLTVPNEIKTSYSNLKNTDFENKKQRLALINDYANASMALYGLVKIEELVELLNMQNGNFSNYEELKDVVEKFSNNGAEYCIYKNYIASRAFEENEFDDVERFADIIYANPRYTPSKETFLKYADYDYYEITPQIINLKKYLVEKMNIEELVAQIIVDEIHHLSAIQGKPQEFVDIFNKYKIITKEEQVYELMNRVLEVSNNTRLVGNHGYTQNEIAEIKGERPKKSVPAVSDKTGRNEPCICGSGKKYKKCCGA
ncbi:MAG: SEC-C metal-binding domain-containing protein [Proteocatella sp.]